MNEIPLGQDRIVINSVVVIANNLEIRNRLMNELFKPFCGRIRVVDDRKTFRSATEFFTEIENTNLKGVVPDLIIVEEGDIGSGYTARTLSNEIIKTVQDMRAIMTMMLARNAGQITDEQIAAKQSEFYSRCDRISEIERENTTVTFGATQLIRGWPLYKGTMNRISLSPILAIVQGADVHLVKRLLEDGADNIAIKGEKNIEDLVDRVVQTIEKAKNRGVVPVKMWESRRPRIIANVNKSIQDLILNGKGRRPDDPRNVSLEELVDVVGRLHVLTLDESGGLSVSIGGKNGENLGQLNIGRSGLNKFKKELSKGHSGIQLKNVVEFLKRGFIEGEFIVTPIKMPLTCELPAYCEIPNPSSKKTTGKKIKKETRIVDEKSNKVNAGHK